MSAISENGVKNGSSDSPWLLLLDSETYAITLDQIKRERARNALPSRFRLTIAHELGHTLSFELKGGKLGVSTKSNNTSLKKRIDILESETDNLAPYLLIPERSIEEFFSDRDAPPSIKDFIEFRDLNGVSSTTLAERLMLMNKTPISEALNSRGCQNFALGVGIEAEGRAVFEPSIIFHNFSDKVLPRMIIELIGNKDSQCYRYHFKGAKFSMTENIRISEKWKIQFGNSSNDLRECVLAREVKKDPSERFLWSLILNCQRKTGQT